MKFRGKSGGAKTPLDVLSRGLTPDASIREIRGLLSGGYGKDASEATITAFTRDRNTIGGIATATVREQLAKNEKVGS